MFRIVTEPIIEASVRAAVEHPSLGAVLAFHGVARQDFDGKRVLALSYEAYAPMAVAEMEAIGAEVARRWPGSRVAMVHRIGDVPIGEASVIIAVGAPHRAECYEASRYCIEQLKQRVPVWKKEIYEDGSAWKANSPS